MQHAASVRKTNSIANSQEKPQAVRRRIYGSNKFVQPLAFDKFHGVEDAAIGKRSHIVHRNDAGMLESGEHAGFANEPVCEIAIDSGNIEHFQRDATLEILVFRGVDDAHAAACDAFDQPITRTGKVGSFGSVAQSFERGVRKEFHFDSQPKAARASR